MNLARAEVGRSIRDVVANRDMLKKSNNKEKNTKISRSWYLIKENAEFSDK